MAGNQLFGGNPMLKLAIPMILGIAVGRFCGFAAAELLPLSAVSLLVLLSALSSKVPKWLFGVAAVVLMFAIGAFVEHKQRMVMVPQWAGDARIYEAQLLEVPLHKGTSTKVLANVVDVDTACAANVRHEGRVYLYFPRSVEADALEVGDMLRFKAGIQPPSNAGNPAEFDIENYHYIKGITGTAYVWGDTWEFLGSGRMNAVMYALAIREKVIDRYRWLGFEDEDLSLLSALTVGEKRDFAQELKESYAAAGASHILALSGLHLGIIYLLATFLLPYRGRRRWVMVLRETVVVAVLWAFAFIAGLPASVVRSAILFTLMSVGRCLRQDSSPLSSLAFAAILMLIFEPHSLFDVGFQLSFSAVFAIVLLAPHLQRFFKVDEHGVVYRCIVNLLILSFVAQLGTLPFVWYHFGVFPLYSLLTGIFVVPLAFVIIVLALLLLATSFFAPARWLFVNLLNIVTSAMNGGVSLVASMPGASVSLPSIGILGAMVVALLVVWLSYALVHRKWHMAALAAGCSLVLCGVDAVIGGSSRVPTGVMVYNNSKNPLLHIVASDGENWLLSTVPQLDAEYEYVSSPFVKREGLAVPQWVDDDYVCDGFAFKNGTVKYGGLKIKLLADDQWRGNILAEPMDVLVLCRGFLGPMKELAEVYPSGYILVDASLYRHSRERILRECVQLGLDAVDISRTGAVTIVPHGDYFEIIPLRGK